MVVVVSLLLFFVFVFAVAPTTTLPFVNHTIVAGSALDLACIANGFPLPVITWLVQSHERLEERVTSSTNFNITHNYSHSTFRIRHARPQLTGVYTCIASNAAGSDTESTNVVVHSKLMSI